MQIGPDGVCENHKNEKEKTQVNIQNIKNEPKNVSTSEF
jgi:hypothetical protein